MWVCVCGCGQRGVQRRDKIEKERSVEQTKESERGKAGETEDKKEGNDSTA
jgi:hypothetical protein